MSIVILSLKMQDTIRKLELIKFKTKEKLNKLLCVAVRIFVA